MIYKINFSAWNDSLDLGEVVKDNNDELIKVLSIIKIESYEGDIIIIVQGVKAIDLE
jgi:hypothetical protein